MINLPPSTLSLGSILSEIGLDLVLFLERADTDICPLEAINLPALVNHLANERLQLSLVLQDPANNGYVIEYAYRHADASPHIRGEVTDFLKVNRP